MELKAFAGVGAFSPADNPESTAAPASQDRGHCLVKLDASTLKDGVLSQLANTGTLGGKFSKDQGNSITVGTVDGKKAITFQQSRLKSSFDSPATLSYNSPFTAAAWVYTPAMAESVSLLQWSQRGGPAFTYAAMMYGTQPRWGAAADWDAGDMG